MMNSSFVQIPKLTLNNKKSSQNVVQTTSSSSSSSSSALNSKKKKDNSTITANSLLPKLITNNNNNNNNNDQVSTGITILQNYQPSNSSSENTSAANTPTLSSTKKQVVGLVEIPEHILIRDIIYVFQGIDGTFIKYNKKSDSYSIDDTININGEASYISKPKRDLVYRLCEFGWLFKKTRNFIINNEFKNSGLTNQSFCSAIHDELTEFYRIIAILETQINKKYDMHNNNNQNNGKPLVGIESPISISSTSTASTTSELPFTEDNLTLIKLFVWIQSPLKKLKVLATCVDSIKTTMKGGEIISQIDTLSRHGDRDIQKLIHSIMFKICQPFFSMVRLWMFKGEINDPYQEFFIKQHEKVQLERTWKEKFAIVVRLLPSFISIPLAKKILVIGKSINYMKQFCNNFKDDKLDSYYYYNIDEDDDGEFENDDEDDEEDEENEEEQPQHDPNRLTKEQRIEKKLLNEESKIIKYKSNNLNYTNKELLQDMIELVARQSSQRLLKIVLERFKFMTHIKALKKYLLLGQGDFIQYLMDLVGEDLSKPVNQISRHKLADWMETAIRNSNAQFEESEFIGRLDIALLPERQGSIGWDIFSLDYHVDSPLNTILSPNDIIRYKKTFHFMWSIKRVEYSLSSVWRKIRTSSKELAALLPIKGEIHKSHIIMNEMIHFISNFQYYLMFEVLECSWNNLKKFIEEEATDLDQLIDAHHQYLQDICTKSFLSNSDSSYECFKKLLSIINKFTLLQSKLVNLSITIYQNTNNQTEEFQASVNKDFNSYKTHLNNLYQDYTNSFYKFQEEILKVKVNQDLNPISLQYMLDFNEYYKNKKE
ncbi:hypothetical protein DICPUDRAFT_148636 [Dictyostelium purpureum]|uniref:Uncharacterized protein n=1 Tax=Dictyostelium purpureum TaxID=5786 RepID=F0ZBM0_DICPU|nr:uncharacterized protein DICPUDRAFT_148636 [Dictyostelium purpureum]EGC38619.1 hypothetical protein DICPUDRAFT_148636 [Dictyostelium purpureum]|eukprot:XP_003284812.1 hypothetical protein DICPUDRAFT_148636 [Dictyostelium purpureum]